MAWQELDAPYDRLPWELDNVYLLLAIVAFLSILAIGAACSTLLSLVRLRIIADMIAEVSAIMRAIPSVFVFLFATEVIIAALFAYNIIVLEYISTAGDVSSNHTMVAPNVTVAQLAFHAIGYATHILSAPSPIHPPFPILLLRASAPIARYLHAAVRIAAAPPKAFVLICVSRYMDQMHLFQIVGVLWSLQLVRAVQQAVLARVVRDWYRAKTESSSVRDSRSCILFAMRCGARTFHTRPIVAATLARPERRERRA